MTCIVLNISILECCLLIQISGPELSVILCDRYYELEGNSDVDKAMAPPCGQSDTSTILL